MDPRVAVIGSGYWGRNHVRVFHELGALRSVADSDPRVREEVRAKYPSAQIVPTPEEAFADAAVLACVIATPAETHFRLVEQALLAGKDVLVEKPLALTVAAGERLVRLAAERGRILMAGHLLLYHPAVLALKELVDKGELGRLQYVYSHRLNLGKIRSEENILWSFAPHDISVILHLLGESPHEVSAQGWNFLQKAVTDVTMTTLRFPSGVGAHIFVSWLNPFKEHRLVIVADRKMAVLDDTEPKDKLVLYPHRIDWIQRQPVPHREKGQVVPIDGAEPLMRECEHFLDCVRTRKAPRSGGESALWVLSVLEASQHSLERSGTSVATAAVSSRGGLIHETAVLDPDAEVGEGTRVWHFSHVMSGARIGKGCSLGQNCFVGRNVRIGDSVKVQNNVSIYEGVTIEDDVFCGPSMVFTNVINPRSQVSRKSEFRPTLVKKGATLGANCTILCGHTIGEHAFVGAGAVVTHDVPDHALVLGSPGRLSGWMCRCGVRLHFSGNRAACEACSSRFELHDGRVVPGST